MNRKEIIENHKRAEKLALNGRIKDAFTIVKRLVNESGDSVLFGDHQILEDSYKAITQFVFRGVPDPKRKEVVDKVLKDILALNDKLKQQILRSKFEQEHHYRSIKAERFSQIDEILEDIVFSKEVSDLLQGVTGNTKPYTVEDFFYHFYSHGKLNELDSYLLDRLVTFEAFSGNEKSMIVSALTISLLDCFDETKMLALYKFYAHRESKVWQRALVGLLLAYYMHDQRLYLYPNLKGISFQLGEDDTNDQDIESVIIQLIRSKDTDRVTRKMQNEILPEMIKLKPKLEDKLGLEEMLNDDLTDDKNPKWEKFFKDTPGLADKMEEFSRMQKEGADVFMSAFSMLKHFDFFKSMHNWFRPFSADNAEVQEALSDDAISIDKEKFLKGIEGSAFMCDSDKYSFVLNVNQMPALQKESMFQMLQSELDQMNELANQEILIDEAARNKTIVTQYVQDLYRFFKLCKRENVSDLFDNKLDIHNATVFPQMVTNDEVIRNIAEFYFESEHYEDALSIYRQLRDKGVNEPELYEKMGYALMQLNQYDEALENFKRAELFDSNRVWNIKQIALCLRKQGKLSQAIDFYLDAERIAPDDIQVKVLLAYVYLQEEKFQEALGKYLEIEEIKGADIKSKRPVGWCAFIVGKLEMAKHYYEEILEENANQYDLMNMGHVLWAMGDVEDAMRYYRKSIFYEGNTLKKFLMGFYEDKKYLVSNGVKEVDIPLVIDHLRYNL